MRPSGCWFGARRGGMRVQREDAARAIARLLTVLGAVLGAVMGAVLDAVLGAPGPLLGGAEAVPATPHVHKEAPAAELGRIARLVHHPSARHDAKARRFRLKCHLEARALGGIVDEETVPTLAQQVGEDAHEAAHVEARFDPRALLLGTCLAPHAQYGARLRAGGVIGRVAQHRIERAVLVRAGVCEIAVAHTRPAQRAHSRPAALGSPFGALRRRWHEVISRRRWGKAIERDVAARKRGERRLPFKQGHVRTRPLERCEEPYEPIASPEVGHRTWRRIGRRASRLQAPVREVGEQHAVSVGAIATARLEQQHLLA